MSQVLTISSSRKHPTTPYRPISSAVCRHRRKPLEKWGLWKLGDLISKLVHLRVELVGVYYKMCDTRRPEALEAFPTTEINHSLIDHY